MRKFPTLAIMGFTMFLCACTNTKLDSYAGTQPVMAFDKFFNGPIQGWGMVHNRSGKVIKRFDVYMVGSWEGNKGKLEEDFTYYDGEKQQRTWSIEKLADDRFVGRASDIVGEAPGRSVGSAIQWQYVMTVKSGGKEYNVNFDDWMFQMNGDVVMNRSKMTKFGIHVGDVTVFMKKLP